jgi:hypothetical protein
MASKKSQATVLPKRHNLNTGYGYNGDMAILNTKGRPTFDLMGCKEEFYASIAKHLAWRNSRVKEKADTIFFGYNPDGKIHTKSTRVAMYYIAPQGFSPNDDRTRGDVANRILDVVTKLCKRMKLRGKTKVRYTANDQKFGAVLVDTDKFFLRSTVSISFLMTIIRGAMFSKFAYDSADDFIAKLSSYAGEHEDDYLEDDDIIGIGADDAYHLSRAQSNGVLDAILNRTLPCLKRRGFNDHRYYHFSDDNGGRASQYGIATYTPSFEFEQLDADWVKKEYKATHEEDDDYEDCDDEYEEVYAHSSSGAHEPGY